MSPSEGTNSTMKPKIVKCDCKHDYQDKKHGKGQRVANHAPKSKAYRCTVCGKLHGE